MRFKIRRPEDPFLTLVERVNRDSLILNYFVWGSSPQSGANSNRPAVNTLAGKSRKFREEAFIRAGNYP